MDNKEILGIIVNAIEDKKGKNVEILDISKISIMADYFVIASGSNTNQIDAILDNLQTELHKAHVPLRSIEGHSGSGWILLDYQDIIIHIFDDESRAFYDLERIWGDSERVTL
ncbi:MAG: ribosome silencing factor [Lachnospiraceae bacterium]|nr:ribosome silencing factor [Lachnospiraceae bacterium]